MKSTALHFFLRRFYIIFLLSFLTGNAYSQHPTLYINFVSHNEPYDLLHQPLKYNASMPKVQELADLIVTKQAAWNFETCDGFVNGALAVEGASSNILRTITGGTYADYIEIDPRNKNLTNIADLYHTLDSAGANPTFTLGGFICNSTDTATPPDWFQYEDTITGITYPTTKWKCKLMWGAGSIDPHTNDVNDYGIWLPDTVDRFHDHNPLRSVWYIGNGCQPIYSLDSADDEQVIIDLIQGIVDSLQNDLWPQDKFYNYSITINQSQFGPMLFGRIANLIDSVNALGSQIAWRTLTQKFDAFQTWTASHASYSQWDCGEVMASVTDPAPTAGIRVFPNPASDACQVEVTDDLWHTLSVWDMNGRKINMQRFRQQAAFDMTPYPAGMYLISVDDIPARRVIKQ